MKQVIKDNVLQTTYCDFLSIKDKFDIAPFKSPNRLVKIKWGKIKSIYPSKSTIAKDACEVSSYQ